MIVLVELAPVELRYQAVLEVVNQGATVTDVAVRFGVTRQTVHRWLRRYAAKGLSGLADGSERPLSCPHQMPAALEARIVELRRSNPGWGPRTILFRLEAERLRWARIERAAEMLTYDHDLAVIAGLDVVVAA